MNLLSLLLLSSVLINLQIAVTESPIVSEAPKLSVVETLSTKQEIVSYIEKQAIQSNIDPRMALHVAKAESSFNRYAVGDGHLTCKRTGLPIRSRGIWQINDCAHPTVTDEQAFDVVWSTEWAMKEMQKNGCRIWSTCPARKG